MRWFFVWLTLFPSPCYAAVCGGLNPVLVTATPLSFGNYDASSMTDTTTNATITVVCTVTLGSTLPNFTVSVSAGGSNSFNPRQMAFLTQKLNYNLYTTASLTSVWGDGTSPTVIQSYNTNDGLAQKNFTIYGDIPTHQYVPTGIYLDSPTITVTY